MKRKPSERTAEQILETHRQSHIRSALSTLSHMRKLIDAVENCLTNSDGFSIYMTDLTDLTEMATGLVLLAAAHGAVANAKRDVTRNK